MPAAISNKTILANPLMKEEGPSFSGRTPLFFISPVEFSSLKQRHQALAEIFARDNFDVIFLNPPRSPGLFCSIERHEKYLRVVSLSIPFCAGQWPMLQNLATRISAKILFSRFSIPTQKSIVWLAHPTLSYLFSFPWKIRIYDRCDRHGTFPGQNSQSMETHEKNLCSRADLVFASSPVLMQEVKEMGVGNPILLPNAAPANWTTEIIPRKPITPPFLAISAGAHYEWTDFDWIEKIAQEPGLEVHIAGRGRGSAFNGLIQRKNISYHGPLSHDGLKALLDRCHIGLVPFKNSPLTEAIDPIKVYEYAARGLEVWAPPVRCLEKHPLVNRVIKNSESIQSFFREKIPPSPKNTKTGFPFHSIASSESVFPIKQENSYAFDGRKIPTWEDRAELILQSLFDGLPQLEKTLSRANPRKKLQPRLFGRPPSGNNS